MFLLILVIPFQAKLDFPPHNIKCSGTNSKSCCYKGLISEKSTGSSGIPESRYLGIALCNCGATGRIFMYGQLDTRGDIV